MAGFYRFSKRIYDVLFSVIGLLVLSPLFLILAAAVKWCDGGPVFFRQQRVGLNGQLFAILKFRTMLVDAEQRGLSITKDGDPRITSVGRLLRKTKLDEFPQLWNVLKGEMSLVGPRPEVPHYVARYDAEQRKVLQLKPGITDLATLVFRNEEELLRAAADVETFYVAQCVPQKISLNLAYARRANLWQDTRIILRTLWPKRVAFERMGYLEREGVE